VHAGFGRVHLTVQNLANLAFQTVFTLVLTVSTPSACYNPSLSPASFWPAAAAEGARNYIINRCKEWNVSMKALNSGLRLWNKDAITADNHMDA
jgi:hypothetical protein